MSRPSLRAVALSGALLLTVVPGVPALAEPPSPGTSVAASEASATYLSVADALTTQDGSTQTVRGYIVGQPVSTDEVVTSNYPNDYALALADSASETDTSRMLYVQIPAELRSQWGLASNPERIGEQVDVTAALEAYFAHEGAKGTTSITSISGGDGGGDGGDGGDGGGDTSDPGTYYNGTEGLSGQALKEELHSIISNQTVLSYDDVWAGLKDVDEDTQDTGSVRLLYSGGTSPKSNNGGDVDNWNREHVWAKSHGDFGTANGPGTDLHHLRPTDVTVNSARGNLDFDIGGTENDEAPGNFADGDSWEPRDEVKGDVARMIFYMAVRYESGDSVDLEVNDEVNNGSAPLHGRLSVLKQWNEQDPPDAFEQRRNERIYANWQGNRNPFIDHPEWVESVF